MSDTIIVNRDNLGIRSRGVPLPLRCGSAWKKDPV